VENTKKKRSTWTVHMDRDLFNKVRKLAEAEGRTIRGQLERTIRDGLGVHALQKAVETREVTRGS
jgi:hypothetical protein